MNARLRLVVGGVIAAVLTSAFIYAWRVQALPAPALTSALDALELWALDARFAARGPIPVRDDVFLLGFDDRTLDERPDLFERRAGMAEVIRAISAAGARVIAVDLIFADPERLIAQGLAEDIDGWLGADPPPPDDPPNTLLRRVQTEAHGDQELVDAIRGAGNVVLGLHVGSRGNEPDKGIGKAKYGQVTPGPWLPALGDRVIVSDAPFVKASARLGMISVLEDATGAVREVSLGSSLGPSVVVPFSVAMLAEYEGVPRANVAFVGEDGSVHLGEQRTIAGQRGRMLLNWRGTDFPSGSVLDLIEGRLPADALRDRVVILGFTHLAEDMVDTPFQREPGFTVHATAVDQILAGDRLQRASPEVDALLTLLAGLFAAGVFLFRVGPTAQVAGTAAVVGATSAGVLVAFTHGALWVTAVGAPLSGALSAATCLANGYLVEGRQRAHLRRAFSHYLSDQLVDELVADPSRVSLTGERRELTVLFTDIRDFTTFSERIGALELADFLRAYFGPMTRAVMRHDGYVDKFIGDAVMAIFGAPVRREDHALRACDAVVDMHRALDAVRPEAERLGIALQIGAGVNTGDMVVGNLGSDERFDFTVLGDAVNLGSRLEGLTKTYGVFCLIGPLTAERVASACVLRRVDLVRVKGKLEPIELFELCAAPAGPIARYEAAEVFQAGIDAWRAGRFAQARSAFVDFAARNPHDKVAPMYLERLDLVGPEAPAGWDGVFVHTKK